MIMFRAQDTRRQVIRGEPFNGESVHGAERDLADRSLHWLRRGENSGRTRDRPPWPVKPCRKQERGKRGTGKNPAEHVDLPKQRRCRDGRGARSKTVSAKAAPAEQRAASTPPQCFGVEAALSSGRAACPAVGAPSAR